MRKILVMMLAMVTLVACDDATAPEDPIATTVEITQSSFIVEIGATSTLWVTVRDQFGERMEDQPVVWRTNSATVATVNNTGVVTGVARGQVFITASVGERVASVLGYVVDPTVSVVTLTVPVATTGFFVGQTLQAIATPRDGVGNALTGFATTWTSSNPAVATVSTTGLITAVSAGTTTISVTAGGRTSTQTVTVRLVPVSTVTLATTGVFEIGRTTTVTPTIFDSNNAALSLSQREFNWSSTNTTVATVSPTGTVTGLTAGTSVITFVIEGRVGLLPITVSEVVVDSIDVVPDTATLNVAQTLQLSATAFDADGESLSTAALNGRQFTWTTANATVAVVSDTGLVTAVATGTTTVTVTMGGVTDTVTITVP